MRRNSCRDCSFSSSTQLWLQLQNVSEQFFNNSFFGEELCFLPRTSSNLNVIAMTSSQIAGEHYSAIISPKNYNKSTRNLDKQKGAEILLINRNHDKNRVWFFTFLLEKDFCVVLYCEPDIINCMFNSIESISFTRYLVAFCCSSKGISGIKKARKAETARSCVRYWMLLGWHRPCHNLYALVSKEWKLKDSR